MRWVVVGVAAAVVAWAGQALASGAPSYGPPPAWVEVAPAPDAPAPDGAPASQILLDDNQSRLGPGGASYYNRRVIRVLKPEGLSALTSESFTWSPDTEDLIIHAISIRRGGQVIDLLNGGKDMLVLRRETGLEMGMLDGRLTATRQIDGLQVGDILDVSWTQTRHDPVMKGHSEDPEGFEGPGETGRYRLRISWPASYPVQWRASPGYGQPQVRNDGDRILLTLDQAGVRVPDPPPGAPSRFAWQGRFEASSFRSWEEVSSLIAPLFETASSLDASSPVRAEAAAIAAASSDPKARAFAALRLVEDKVRYFFIGTDDGGYVPADADLTWKRRFGDCKGKTVLLLALLKQLGVEAEPALVTTVGGDALGDALPGLQRFNHVLVRAVIGGKVYWLDGTRSGDVGGLDGLAPPAWRWALPLTDKGSGLEAITQPPLEQPSMDIAMHIDASKGLDAPAPAQIRVTVHGDIAIGFRTLAALQSKDELERTALRSFGGRLAWISLNGMQWRDEPATNGFELDFTGAADMDWRDNDDLHVKEFVLQGGSAGASAFPRRDPGPGAEAPFAVPYPLYITSVIEVKLPDGGAGFSVRGANVDQTVADFQIKRSAVLQRDVARFIGSVRTLAPEVSAADAMAANKEMRRLAETQDLIRDAVAASAPTKSADASPAGGTAVRAGL